MITREQVIGNLKYAKKWKDRPTDETIGKMSEIQTDCSNLDSCENCKYDDGECCRLLYEAKMESEEQE